MYNVAQPLSTPGIDALMALYSMDDDNWETNAGWCFAVAEVIWHLSAEEVPEEMDFRHSEVSDADTWREDWPDAEVADLYELETVTDDDLLAFARYVAAVDADFRSRGENF